MRRLVCSFVGLGLFAQAPEARARGGGGELWFAADVHGQWLRRLPMLESEAVETDTRAVPKGEHVVPGALALLGVQVAFGFTVDDRIVLPLSGASVGTSIGSYRRVRTSVDGSIAELHPWTTSHWTLLLPGLGVRGKDRRLQWQVLVRPGVGWTAMGGQVAAAGQAAELSATASTFTLRAEGELCRRLDPVSRVCLFAGPTLYEHGWLNGGLAGLRWEGGP